MAWSLKWSEVSLCKVWKVISRQQHQNFQVLDYPFPPVSLSLHHVQWNESSRTGSELRLVAKFQSFQDLFIS